MPQFEKKLKDKLRKQVPLKVLSEYHFSLLEKHSQTQDQFILVIQMIYRHSKMTPDPSKAAEELIRNTDESKFNLSAWIQAIEVFHFFLKENDRDANFVHLLEYIQCCGESSEAKGSKQSLPHLVKEMLQTYGYEG